MLEKKKKAKIKITSGTGINPKIVLSYKWSTSDTNVSGDFTSVSFGTRSATTININNIPTITIIVVVFASIVIALKKKSKKIKATSKLLKLLKSMVSVIRLSAHTGV